MVSPQKENGHIRIATELWEAFCRIRIPGEARQILDFILRKTYGFNKKEDYIAISQFKGGTMLNSVHIVINIKKLVEMGLISITEKGNEKGNKYRFNKDFDSWKPLPKKVTLPKKVMTVTEKGNSALPKKVHTIDNNTINNTINRRILDLTPAVVEFWKYFLLKTEKNFKLTPDKEALIKSRLKDYTIEQLKLAVDNFIADPWDGRKNHLDLIYCIGKQRGKPDSLEKWINASIKKSDGLDIWLKDKQKNQGVIDVNKIEDKSK